MPRFLSTCVLILTIRAANAQTGMSDSVRIANDSSQLKIFERVDIEAAFPGGETAWKKYLEKNLRAYVPIKKRAPAGIYTVWVQFIVDKHGNVSDVKSLTNYGFGMEQEVVRIIKNSARWEPASQNGRIVKSFRAQPVTFLVEADRFEILSKAPYVFYSGIDNPVKIRVRKIKPDDLQVTISQGTIIPLGHGDYIVRQNNTGRVVIRLFNKRKKEIGSASFEVRPQEDASGPPVIIRG
jgi:gliding motility-associated GldM-like protein/TonB-like protein